MNNSSKIKNNLVFGDHITEASARILTKLNDFVSKNNYLFDYYTRYKYLQQPLGLEIIINNVQDFFWRNKIQKFLTFSIVACFLVFIAIKLRENLFSDVIIASVVLMYILLFFIQLILFLFPPEKIINAFKKTKNSKYITNIASYDISIHLEYAKDIGTNNTSQEIKIEEDRFKVAMLTQVRSKEIGDSLIPLLSIIYVLFLFWVFGNPQSITIGGIGLNSIVIFSLSFLAKISYKNLLINQHCLFILQKALLIAEEREKSNKLISVEDVNEKYEYLLQELKNIAQELKTKDKKSSINKNIKGKNLFQELKKIKITDAPRDLSTNFNSYIDREKSAGTDIH